MCFFDATWIGGKLLRAGRTQTSCRWSYTPASIWVLKVVYPVPKNTRFIGFITMFSMKVAFWGDRVGQSISVYPNVTSHGQTSAMLKRCIPMAIGWMTIHHRSSCWLYSYTYIYIYTIVYPTIFPWRLVNSHVYSPYIISITPQCSKYFNIVFRKEKLSCIHLTSPDCITISDSPWIYFPWGEIICHGTWWCWAAPWPSPFDPRRWPRRQRSARSFRDVSCDLRFPGSKKGSWIWRKWWMKYHQKWGWWWMMNIKYHDMV